MEKIESLVAVLERFGDALGNVKILTGNIENEVKKHTSSIKENIVTFKENHSKEEEEHRELISQLRTKMETLKIPKQVKEEKMIQSSKNLSTNVPIKSYSSVVKVESSNNTPNVYSHANNHSLKTFLEDSENWWENPDIRDELNEFVDWAKEKSNRVLHKQTLTIQEGWRKRHSTYGELEDALHVWTGNVRWSVLKQTKIKSGRILFDVKFESEEDRNKIFAMRHEIGEEGILVVSESLTYVERRERDKMMIMTKRLRAGGRTVKFEDKRICVDGEWWKYYFAEGWKRL